MCSRHRPAEGADSVAVADPVPACQVPGCIEDAVATVIVRPLTAADHLTDDEMERRLCQRHRDGLIRIVNLRG